MKKSRRFTLAVTETAWNLIRQAAACTFQSPPKFIRWATELQAKKVLESIPVRKVSARTMRSLLELLEKPPKPNRALRNAFRRYKRAIATGRLVVRD